MNESPREPRAQLSQDKSFVVVVIENLNGDHLVQSHLDIVIVNFIEMLSIALLPLLLHYFFVAMSSKSMI